MAILGTSIKIYFRQVHDEVLRLCAVLQERPSAETIHDLRVQLKRVRFLRNLFKHYGSRESARLFRPYIELFDAAGEIRGYQVNRYRLEGSVSTPKAREQGLQDRFAKNLNRSAQEIGAAFTRVEALLAVVRFPGAAAYCNRLAERVGKRITPFLFTHQLHHTRKLLKELIYSTELCEPLRQRIYSRFRLNVANELEDKIGDWHDLALALRSPQLKPATREKITAQKKAKLNQVYQLLRAGVLM